MDIVIKVLFFITTFFLGASIGSFSLVIVRRSHNKEFGSWVTGKSVCESCKKQLKWWELIPFVSFLALRGKCSKCKTKIDPSHFLCETALGILFVCAAIALVNGWFAPIEFGVFLASAVVFTALSFEDALYREVTVIPLYVIGMLGAVYQSFSRQSFWPVLIIAGLFLISMLIGRNDNFALIGAGDFDAGIAIYAFLFSFFGFVDMIIYASLVGIVISLTVLRKNGKSIPFVPCMFVGYLISVTGVSVTGAIYGLMSQILSISG